MMMGEISESNRIKQPHALRLWFFNPFVKLAGVNALMIGLIFMAGTALLGALGNCHLDGVLNVHFGNPAPYWQFVLEMLINWLSLVIPLAISARLLSRSSWRVIDLLGTQALALWPYLIVTVIGLISKPAIQKVTENIDSIMKNTPEALQAVKTELFIVTAFGIFSLLIIIWTVMLMYRSYAISCNVKGPKAIISFIVSLIIAITGSSFIIQKFLLS